MSVGAAGLSSAVPGASALPHLSRPANLCPSASPFQERYSKLEATAKSLKSSQEATARELVDGQGQLREAQAQVGGGAGPGRHVAVFAPSRWQLTTACCVLVAG